MGARAGGRSLGRLGELLDGLANLLGIKALDGDGLLLAKGCAREGGGGGSNAGPRSRRKAQAQTPLSKPFHALLPTSLEPSPEPGPIDTLRRARARARRRPRPPFAPSAPTEARTEASGYGSLDSSTLANEDGERGVGLLQLEVVARDKVAASGREREGGGDGEGGAERQGAAEAASAASRSVIATERLWNTHRAPLLPLEDWQRCTLREGKGESAEKRKGVRSEAGGSGPGHGVGGRWEAGGEVALHARGGASLARDGSAAAPMGRASRPRTLRWFNRVLQMARFDRVRTGAPARRGREP